MASITKTNPEHSGLQYLQETIQTIDSIEKKCLPIKKIWLQVKEESDQCFIEVTTRDGQDLRVAEMKISQLVSNEDYYDTILDMLNKVFPGIRTINIPERFEAHKKQLLEGYHNIDLILEPNIDRNSLSPIAYQVKFVNKQGETNSKKCVGELLHCSNCTETDLKHVLVDAKALINYYGNRNQTYQPRESIKGGDSKENFKSAWQEIIETKRIQLKDEMKYKEGDYAYRVTYGGLFWDLPIIDKKSHPTKKETFLNLLKAIINYGPELQKVLLLWSERGVQVTTNFVEEKKRVNCTIGLLSVKERACPPGVEDYKQSIPLPANLEQMSPIKLGRKINTTIALIVDKVISESLQHMIRLLYDSDFKGTMQSFGVSFDWAFETSRSLKLTVDYIGDDTKSKVIEFINEKILANEETEGLAGEYDPEANPLTIVLTDDPD